MAGNSDYEDDDDIVAHYENQGSDGERGGPYEVEEATSDNETGVARKVDPSGTHVARRNPVPKLNTERLKGPNGVQTIEKYFEGFKFYGKGHEKTDLDRIMKRLEHWSYRLFPKYHFDDFLARVEQLGTKKDLQVYLKKYRLDMLTTDDDSIVRDNADDNDDEEDRQESAPLDDFDLLITEQIQKQKQAEARVADVAPSVSNEDAFNALLMQSDDTPSSQQAQGAASTADNSEPSDDVRERIERNKQLAIQRRLQRQKERDEEAKRRRLVEGTDAETRNESDDNTICDGTSTSRGDGAQLRIDENTDGATFAVKSQETPLDEESLMDQTHEKQNEQ